MERKSYFSTGEIIGYFLLIIIGINILVAIPIVIKLFPIIQEQINTVDVESMRFDFLVDDILLANIAWQFLSLLVMFLLFKKKNIDLYEYFDLRRNLTRRSYLLTVGVFLILVAIMTPTSEYFEIEPNPTMLYLLNNGNIVLIFITAVIAAPIIEEVIFRGWIFSEMEARYGQMVAFHVSSVLFTIIHIQYGAAELIMVLVISYSLALLRMHTRNLLFPIMLHFLNNLAAMAEFFLLYQ